MINVLSSQLTCSRLLLALRLEDTNTKCSTVEPRHMFGPDHLRCSAQSWNGLPDGVVAETDIGKFKGMLANCLGDVLFVYQP